MSRQLLLGLLIDHILSREACLILRRRLLSKEALHFKLLLVEMFHLLIMSIVLYFEKYFEILHLWNVVRTLSQVIFKHVRELNTAALLLLQFKLI